MAAREAAFLAATPVLGRERGVLRQAGGDLTGADIGGCVRVLSCLLHLLDNVDMG